jgi:hypothetical protein
MRRFEVAVIVLLSILLSSCAKQPTATINPVEPTSATLTPADLEDWGNYDVFRSGLISSEQPILSQMTDASIYHIDIRISDDLLSLQGKEEVQYTNQESEPLNEIYFQLFPNMEGGSSTINSLLVDGAETQPVIEDRNSTLRVPLPQPLQPGEKNKVELNFTLSLPVDAGGNYGLFGFIDNILVLDGFYPAIPVYDDQGWHKGLIPANSDTTFQDESFYLVTVTAPENLVIITSGVQMNSEKNNGLQVATFAQGPSRDFYIAASDEFTVISEKIGETTVNSYTINGYPEGQQMALDTAVHSIEAFNSQIGIYPYTEFDVVSTPMQGAYGIEYPGIVGINYALYDLSQTTSGMPTSAILESTVAHETGHQWFYSVVGNDQINEPWLDESMTQYITALYFLEKYGKGGYESIVDSWYSRWDRVSDEPMPIGLSAASYEGKEYSAIVYGRGPIFVETLSITMKKDVFKQFLKDYYSTNKWGIMDTVAFKQQAEQHCQCDLTELFDEWVY